MPLFTTNHLRYCVLAALDKEVKAVRAQCHQIREKQQSVKRDLNKVKSKIIELDTVEDVSIYFRKHVNITTYLNILQDTRAGPNFWGGLMCLSPFH